MPKTCKGCDKLLPDDAFYRRSPPLEKYLYSKCKACHKTMCTSNDRKRLTGWTEEEYRLAYEQQQGKCYVCKGDTNGRGLLHADHDHATEKKRKLLCSRCNVTLGNVQDDPDLLRELASYLEEHGDAKI